MKGRTIGFSIAGLCLVGIAVGGTIFAGNALKANANKPQIKTAPVRRGAVLRSVSDTGVLQAFTTVEVKSNVGGEVVQMAVEEGQFVEAGQLIAKIDKSDAQLGLDQSEADLNAARAKLAQSTKRVPATREIDPVTKRPLRAEEPAAIRTSREALATAKARLVQAEKQADIQPGLTDANIRQAEAGLASAQAALDQFRISTKPQTVAAAQASYDQAAANADYAERDLARQRELLAQGFVSRKVVESAEQQQRTTKAQLETAKSKLDTIQHQMAQDLRSAEAKVAQAEASLDTARANTVTNDVKQQDLISAQAAVRQAEANLIAAEAGNAQEVISAASQVSRSEASLKNAQAALNYTTITAPRAGVVVKKYVEQGTVVNGSRTSAGAGVTLVEIADVSVMYAVMNVDETDIGKIKVRQEVDVSVDAFPDELYGGTVTKIAPRTVTDQNVATIPVTVMVRANNRRLKPGMGVNCEFVIEKKRDVLMVPSEAIKNGSDGSTVTVLENNVQKVVKVTTGMVGNDTTEVTEDEAGLKEGQQVITAIIDPKKKAATGTNNNRPPGGMPGGMPGGGMPPMGGR